MIKLSQEEIDYLLKEILSKDDIGFIRAVKSGELNSDEADELRDMCSEKLDIVGYDENYDLNKDGTILNQLIDKLYIR